MQVGANYSDFSTTLTEPGPYIPAPGSGVFQVTSVGSGSAFATGGVTTGEQGNIQSLDEGAGPLTPPITFITFTGAGGSSDSLTATGIPAGAVGPFTLTDTANGAEATFEVLGYVGTNTSSSFTAKFAIGFPGLTVAELFTNLPKDELYCANIDVSATPSSCDPFPTVSGTTPEPRYTLLAGLVLLAAFVVRRRLHFSRG